MDQLRRFITWLLVPHIYSSMRATFLFAVLACANACAHAPTTAQPSNDEARRIQFSGVEYRRLTGTALRQAIVGATVRSTDIVVSGDNGWHYDGDGRTYWGYVHRGIPRIGTHDLRQNFVCHNLGSEAWCAAIYKSEQGDFLRIHVSPDSNGNHPPPERVTVSPSVPPFPFRSR